MSEWLKENTEYYIYAEYNPYFIYMGWWLYAIPVDNLTDERDIGKWEQPTWLNYDWRLDALMKAMGCPELRDYRGKKFEYCCAFMKKHPAGTVCQVKGDGREFIPQQSDLLGDYLRIVRQRQLDHIAKVQEENEKA